MNENNTFQREIVQKDATNGDESRHAGSIPAARCASESSTYAASVERSVESGQGVRLGHEAAERAAKRAGDEWVKAAKWAFYRYAQAHGSFTIEEVRAANPNLPEPPDLRAWGQIALAAKRKGIVKVGGWTPAKANNVHGGVITLWVSQLI